MDLYTQLLQNYEDTLSTDVARRVRFIRDTVEGAGAKGALVGLSGGIDSAVVLALLVKALGEERVLALWLPIESDPRHAHDAQTVAETFGVKLHTIDLIEPYRAFLGVIKEALSGGLTYTGNIKARLRMIALYAYANALGYLVSDTSNRSELYVGYITKGGDAVADFNPLASLVKAQVRLLARYLGIPEAVIEKPPSADLFPGQNDENELGVTYEALDRYLLTGEGEPEVVQRIEYLHAISRHKREPMSSI
ncbi:MAG: NAD synthetase [Candidatus Carbobacillus altaicus]|uniref:NH(3)-dependent NAD(+) synthetase n=1 Tax=Candidatus Carbonibacillus altaicus TaxID=2163959 RepID=A0A2R6Y596_9BACL|nr:MAG: NAD synthetase [Candidatus Carbobacillus altaicus]